MCVWLVGYTTASGVLTASFVVASSQTTAVNLYQTPTYQVTSMTGSITVNGQGTYALSVAPTNLVSSNDNWVYYQGGAVPLLWTDSYGLVFTYNTGSKGVAGPPLLAEQLLRQQHHHQRGVRHRHLHAGRHVGAGVSAAGVDGGGCGSDGGVVGDLLVLLHLVRLVHLL